MNRKLYLFTLILLLVTTLLGIAPVLAEEGEKYPGEKRFQLYVDCEPMYVFVKDLSPDADKIGLTKARIMTATEARLRSAHIFNEKASGSPFLVLYVDVVGLAFHIDLALMKGVKDPLYSQTVGLVPTWLSQRTGMHGQRSDFILSVIQELLDHLIVEYLQVNQDACDQKP